jgi:hypothetical protein
MTRRTQLALLIAIYFLLSVGCTRDLKANSERFESSRWKTSDLRERGRMTKDLVGRELLNGMLSDEVREMLGDPDNVTHAGEFEYRTDPGSWMSGANNGPWIHYLNVEFGEDHRVRKAYMTD